jgi:hypothetical protein
MSRSDRSTEQQDRSTRRNDAEAGSSSSDAEARARRLEEIRQSILEEWRWRDPERED